MGSSLIGGSIRGSAKRPSLLLLLIAMALLACSPSRITRDRWQQMSRADKTLYVSSLIGGEKAKQQKGGSGRRYSAPPDHYASQIDAAYTRGDQRDVDAVFQEMADPK